LRGEKQQAGSKNPTSIRLNILELENLIPHALPEDPFFQLPTLYPGLSPGQAFAAYLEENGYTHKGPWQFMVELRR